MPQIVWSTKPDGSHDYYNARWYEFTGVPQGSTDGDGWAGMFHPDDQPEAWKRWSHSLKTGEPYEVEYRLRHHTGKYRWTIGRANPIRDPNGLIVRWIGTCTDIHDAKMVAEQNEVLSRELSHRIKNIFAVINGIITLSVRKSPEAAHFSSKLRKRIAALGRANEFVRPHSERSRPVVGETTMIGLLKNLAEPYPAFDEGRILITGDDLAVDDRGATPISLVFHELLTNSMKYGSLSSPEGTVAINLRAEEERFAMVWSEQGGPLIAGPPDNTGFGTQLAEISVERQLDGEIERQWMREGLVVTVRIDKRRLFRG